MPFIRIEMLKGRTQEQKEAVMRGITEVMVREAKARPEGVHIIIHEVEGDQVARGGETLAAIRARQ